MSYGPVPSSISSSNDNNQNVPRSYIQKYCEYIKRGSISSCAEISLQNEWKKEGTNISYLEWRKDKLDKEPCSYFLDMEMKCLPWYSS